MKNSQEPEIQTPLLSNAGKLTSTKEVHSSQMEAKACSNSPAEQGNKHYDSITSSFPSNTSKVVYSKHSTMGKDIPDDRYNLAYCISLYLGIAVLFSFHAFISPAKYFSDRFHGSPYQRNWEGVFSMTYNITCNIFFVVSVFYEKSIPQRYQIIVPIWTFLLIFLTTSVLVTIPSIPAVIMFWVTVISLFFCAISFSFIASGIYALCAQLPPLYMQAFVTGQALAGVVAAMINFLTILFNPQQDDPSNINEIHWSALAYFTLATILFAICLGLYHVLEELPFVQYYTKHSRKDTLSVITETLGNSTRKLSLNDLSGSIVSTIKPVQGKNTIMDIAKRIWIHIYIVFIVLTVTLSIYPTISVQVTSTAKSSNRFFTDLFVPFSFVNFNLGDSIGRISAGFIPSTKSGGTRLWIPATIRLVFIFLLLACHTNGNGIAADMEIFVNDAWPILFMTLLGMTQGIICTLTMMYGPSYVDSEDMAQAGMILGFFLNLGCGVGSIFAFILAEIFI